MQQISRDVFDFWTQLDVRWGDVDRLGHVNNVQYFRYSEEGRTRWFDMLLKDSPGDWSKGQGPILAAIQCDFLHQLHHPATIEVGTRAIRLGNSSIQVQQAFFVTGEGEPVASLSSRLVWFDYISQKPVPVPQPMRERLRKDQAIPPEEP